MNRCTQIVLINTGNDESRLTRLEDGMRRIIEPRFQMEVIRLGYIQRLADAYHQAAISISNPDSLLIFCHQDACPVTPDDAAIIRSQPGLPGWLDKTLENVTDWIDTTIDLASEPDTGLIGVAGALGLMPDAPWWQYPDLSGAILHSLPQGKVKLNPYGHWGSVAVLDGLCLMVRRETYNLIGAPTPGLGGFHFYDMDFSLRSLAAGLTNWTVPLLLWHDSPGVDCENENWRRDQRQFVEAWGEVLPVQTDFKELKL